MNIPPPLLPLFHDGFIVSVTRPLMSGKEASVFLVETREGLCVAKVYKDAQNRSFRQRVSGEWARRPRGLRGDTAPRPYHPDTGFPHAQVQGSGLQAQ